MITVQILFKKSVLCKYMTITQINKTDNYARNTIIIIITLVLSQYHLYFVYFIDHIYSLSVL